MLSYLALLPLLHVSYAAVINVVVGGPGVLQYNPPFVNASVGDTILFTMKQKNHTVTQSSFNSPCSRLPSGIDSGFVPVADNVTSGFPVATLQVRTTDPLWFYCRQANHCQQGMVFAVNPGDKFAAFQAAATGTTSSSTAASSVSATATTATSASTSTASSGSGVDHKIIVGGPSILAYSPSNITAQIGDTITFEFHQKNHTVTASSFDTPCRALSSTSTTGQLGFDSGFMPVAVSDTVFPTFTIVVNDTNPIWAYCRQANHCGSGMVFSANAVESGPKNFSAFEARAKAQNGTTSNSTSTGGSSTPTSDALVASTFKNSFVWILAAVSFLLIV